MNDWRLVNENPWKEYVSGFYPKEESELVAAGYEYIVDGWYAALRIVFYQIQSHNLCGIRHDLHDRNHKINYKRKLTQVHDLRTSVQHACIICLSFTRMESTIRNFTIPSSLKHFGIKMKHILLPKLYTLKFIPGKITLKVNGHSNRPVLTD